MAYELKTNTATRIAVGPLVDPTDGKTAETALTVTGLSVEIFQIKNDGNAVVRAAFSPTASGGNNDMVHVTDDTTGMYDLELTASQVNWLGNGRIAFYDVDGFLVHWIDIQVVSAAYFDWKYGSTIPKVDVDTIKTQTVTCGAGVTVLASVGTATTSTAQTADHTANIAAILADTGTDGVVVAPASKTGYSLTATTGLGNQTANITGTISTVTSVTNGVSLADDAITAAKFDESTAYPLKSADTGATAVSRTGADSDTLETLSDQLDVVTTHLTDLKGATFDSATDSNEAIRNRGDAAWVTATGFSTIDAAGIRTAVGLASANLDTQLGDLPTNAELAAATIARVTLVDTCTTNTDMRGTDSAALASVCTEARLSELDAGTAGKAAHQIDSIKTDTGTTIPAAIDAVPTADEVKTALEAAGSHLTLIKAKTDKMTYTSGNDLDVNVQKINDIAVTGTGAVADPWGPA